MARTKAPKARKKRARKVDLPVDIPEPEETTPAEPEETMSSSRFEVGQRVKFRPTHNKALELTGTISDMSEDGQHLTVTAEADGKVVEVERDFDASADDCREADDD